MVNPTNQPSGNASDINNHYPEYLQSYDALTQYIRGQLDSLSTTEKGLRFARTVLRLVPLTEVGLEFNLPILEEKKSNDEGIDLTATGKDGRSKLYIQSKLWIDRADAIDSIISKFQSYHTSHHLDSFGRQYLWDLEETTNHYLVVTLSPLKGILNKYEKQSYSSKDFYQQMTKVRRLHFVDGPQILSILRAAYKKLAEIPTNLALNLEASAICKDKVYIGIISSTELRRLYHSFGDALFF